MSNSKKSNKAAFISNLGAHRPKSVHQDLKMPEYIEELNKSPEASSSSRKFSATDAFMSGWSKIGAGIRTINKVTGGTFHNGESLLNFGAAIISYLTQSSSQTLGKNDAVYHKTHTHIGKRTSEKIQKLQEGAFVEKQTKSFVDTSMDYINHTKRKLLHISSGFNEKSFNFLAEDTIFTLQDFYKLLKIDERFKKELNSSDGLKEIIACIKKSHFQMKIKNKLDCYSAHVTIHLIRIKDGSTDIRGLIEECSHNSTNLSQDNIGKLPKDFQYSDPITTDYKNKCVISFLTDLRCSLTQSTKFKELGSIVKSWHRTLPPASIWEFNLTTHFGRGISVNTIYDWYNRSNYGPNSNENTVNISLPELSFAKVAEVINEYRKSGEIRISPEKVKEILKKSGEEILSPLQKIKGLHPVNYILCLEVVGDRRSTIKREVDSDLFSGYSPVLLSFEFQKLLTFLNDQNDPDNILVYKKTIQERNFTDSVFETIFNGDRSPKFHVPIDDINLLGKGKTKKEPKPKYSMDYDQVVMNGSDQPTILEGLGKLFESVGFDKNEALSEDKDLNFEMQQNQDENSTSTPPRPESETDPENNNNLRG